MFQSSPAYKGGRFSSSMYEMSFCTSFQSSPAYKGGRFAEKRTPAPDSSAFQSSPAYKGGRFEETLVGVGSGQRVSILARL